MISPDWDQYFMSIVYLTSMRSKDRSTHIGAIIVDNDNRVLSMGYNSFLSGSNDDDNHMHESPTKYQYTEHGERNAIYNANWSLKGSRIYTQWYPCADCARGIVSKGIKEVILHKEWNDLEHSSKWDHTASENMFKTHGVNVRYWSGKLLNIIGYKSGQIIDMREDDESTIKRFEQ